MKCISCGKNFDEEKYYRICPKCGTYNNVKKATPDFSQGSRQTGGSCGNGQMGTSGNNASGGQQDPFWQELHGGNRGQEYRQQSDGQQTYGQPNYDQQDIFHRTEQEIRREHLDKRSGGRRYLFDEMDDELAGQMERIRLGWQDSVSKDETSGRTENE